MIDEINTYETTNTPVENRTEIVLSTGQHLVFKPEKELTWGDYSKYQDLGAGLTGSFDKKTDNLAIDMSNISKGNRAQKEFLIKFFWDAYNVKFDDLKIPEIIALLKPIKALNPLDGLTEELAD